MAYSFYDAYLTIATDPSDTYKNDQQAFINAQFANTPSVYTVEEELIFGTQTFTNLEARITHVINPKTGENQGDDYRNIIFKNVDIQKGLGIRYRFDNNIWLTINSDYYKYTTANSILRRCNNVVKFYDEDGALIQEPCILDYGLTSTQFDFDEAINIDAGKKYLIMQNNDSSSKIDVNRRFIFNGKAFKVEQVERFLNNETFDSDTVPLLYIKTMKDQESDQDDLVNNIANAFDTIYTVEIDQGNISQSIGYTAQLTAVVKLNDEVVDRDLAWASSDDLICTVDSNGNIEMIADGVCSIAATLEGNTSVNDSINIEVTATPASNIEVRIENNITEILKNTTQPYTVFKFDNNVQQVDTFSYALSGADSSSYVFTNIDGNNFSVKSLKFDYTKLKVTCTSNVDSSVGEIEIQLKNAF